MQEFENIAPIADNTDENEVQCYLCNRFSHKACYSIVDFKPGTYFICSVCIKAKVKEPEVVKSDEKPEGETPAPDEDKEEIIREETKKDTICPRLVVGECPHGITGKDCDYKHPKWCFKFTRYGDKAPEGCRRGNRCWYYHPKLCENSLKLKICLNKKCKEVHILGTRRQPPKN